MANVLPIDSNSRLVPALTIGYGKTFAAGVVAQELGGQIIRVKAVGDTSFRLESNADSVILISDKETEKFCVPLGEQIRIISGSLNIMW